MKARNHHFFSISTTNNEKEKLFSVKVNADHSNLMVNDQWPSIKKIKQDGQFLGSGAYGEAYKIGSYVYKLYEIRYKFDYSLAERSARYWNETYEKIYSGKYKSFAVATSAVIDDIPVLITPYIEGEALTDGLNMLKGWHYVRMSKEFSKISLKMYDSTAPGNIRIYGKYKDPLPIDFDRVCAVPEPRYGGISSFFPTPTTPMTRQTWEINQRKEKCNIMCNII